MIEESVQEAANRQPNDPSTSRPPTSCKRKKKNHGRYMACNQEANLIFAKISTSQEGMCVSGNRLEEALQGQVLRRGGIAAREREKNDEFRHTVRRIVRIGE